MAENKAGRFSWLNPFNKKDAGSDTPEVKALKDQFDQVLGEMNDSYETKFLDTEPSQFNSHFSADFGGIDQQVDVASLQRLFSTETWVYTAVMAIAKSVAALPSRMERKKTISREVVNEYTNEKETVKQDIWIDASGEKMNALFERPNEWTTRTEFLLLLMIDLLTAGEYYIYMDSDIDLTSIENGAMDAQAPNSPFGRLMASMSAASPVKAMYRIPPYMIKPVPSEDKTYIAGYMMQSDKGTYSFNIAEIMHVKLPNPNDPFHGQSPLVAAFKPTLLDRFTTEHMVRFYKAGARLGGVITSEKSLNKEQLGRFQRSFESNFTGRANHHRTLILPPGMKYEMIEQNPAETALLEFCKYNRDAILSVYNVPPIKVGVLDKANYANALVQLKIFFSDTVQPYLGFIEDGFNCKKTFMPYSGNYRFKFDISQVEALRENFKEKAEAAKFMIDAGLTINEVRRQVWQKGPIDGGDQCKAIVDIKQESNPPLFAAAPAPTNTKDVVVTPQADAAAVDPTTNTRLTFSQRVAQLVQQYVTNDKLPLDVATERAIAQAALEGYSNGDPSAAGSQPAAQPGAAPKDAVGPSAPSGGIGTQQNADLIHTDVGTRKPKLPEEEDEKTLGAYLADMLEKLDDDQEITPEFIQELVELFQSGDTTSDEGKAQAAAPTATVAPSTAPAEVLVERPVAFGFSKDHLVSAHKTFAKKTDPMIQKRLAIVQRWFKSLSSAVMNRLGANIKSFGLHKARDKDDVKDITDLDAYKKLIDQYVSEIDAELAEAYTFGYSDTMASFSFGVPSKGAKEFLEKFAAKEVTGITETTMDQMKSVLTDAFAEGVAVTEVGARIQAKFAEISAGRAMTIARTETLTAVSYGRQQKREDWKKQYPEKKLVKIWVGSGKAEAREEHAAMNGESVDVDDEFSNGLMFPRDMEGDPSDVINCGCTDITADADSADDIIDTLTDDGEDDAEEQATETVSDDGPEDAE